MIFNIFFRCENGNTNDSKNGNTNDSKNKNKGIKKLDEIEDKIIQPLNSKPENIGEFLNKNKKELDKQLENISKIIKIVGDNYILLPILAVLTFCSIFFLIWCIKMFALNLILDHTSADGKLGYLHSEPRTNLEKTIVFIYTSFKYLIAIMIILMCFNNAAEYVINFNNNQCLYILSGIFGLIMMILLIACNMDKNSMFGLFIVFFCINFFLFYLELRIPNFLLICIYVILLIALLFLVYRIYDSKYKSPRQIKFEKDAEKNNAMADMFKNMPKDMLENMAKNQGAIKDKPTNNQ